VVKIEEVKLDYTPGPANAWDDKDKRFFINFKDDPDGRKIKIAAKLSRKLKNVVLHFMLAPDLNNKKAANWGKDMPATWKWKDITQDVKHADKQDQKDFLHWSEKSDGEGQAAKELTLSRFGGDKFQPAAYVEQDPHMAKYVEGHADLEKRKPVFCAHKIEVWRKFWYHEVKVEGMPVAGFGNAAETYKDVKATMEAADPIEVSRAEANGIKPLVFYPKHMVSYYLNAARTAFLNNYPGDAGEALVVGDANQSRFLRRVPPAADKPVKIPMINAHGLWIAEGVSAASDTGWVDLSTDPFPIPVAFDKQLLDPPLQGGTLFNAGEWEAMDWDAAANGGAGDWVNFRNGNFTAADLSLDENRNNPFEANITRINGLVLGVRTSVHVFDLIVNGGKFYLGTSYKDGIVNAYTRNNQQDFINTINHELGHSFAQVAQVANGKQPAGIPGHPLQYEQDGSHCNYQDQSCLMYECGPQPIHLDRYCEVCHPYVLVQNMRT
jgi:hypothetical protein